MKHIQFNFWATLLLGVMLFMGCSDPCKDLTCEKGKCVDGLCECDPGYEGVTCNTARNAKFTGNYTLNEACSASGAVGPYQVAVTAVSSNPTEVNFASLWSTPGNVVVGIVGDDGLSLTIARQLLIVGWDIEVLVGSISSDHKTINITYKIYASGSTTVNDICTAVLSH